MAITSARDDWDELCERYYQSVSRFDPQPQIKATWGSKRSLFNDLDDDQHYAQIALKEMMLSSIDEFPVSELDSNRCFQRVFIKRQLAYELSEMLRSGARNSDPLKYLPYRSLIQLMLNPVAQFSEVLLNSLKAIPERLRVAKSHLAVSQSVVDLYLLAAIEAIKANEQWLSHIPTMAVVNKYTGNPDHLIKDIDNAIYALKDYRLFLENDCKCYINKVESEGLKQHLAILYQLSDEKIKKGEVLTPDNSMLKPLSEISTLLSPFSSCSKVSLQEPFSEFNLDRKVTEAERSISPIAFVLDVITKSNFLGQFEAYDEKFKIKLPVKDQLSLNFCSFKLFTLGLLTIWQNNLLKNEEEQAYFYQQMDVLAYIDYQLHWKQIPYFQVIEKINELSAGGHEDVEDLVLLAAQNPGFYFSAVSYFNANKSIEFDQFLNGFL